MNGKGVFKRDTQGRRFPAGLSSGLRGGASAPRTFCRFYSDCPVSGTGVGCIGALGLEESLCLQEAGDPGLLFLETFDVKRSKMVVVVMAAVTLTAEI